MEDDQGTGRRVAPRRLRWDFQTDRIGTALGGLFSKLIKLRLAHPAFRSDNFDPTDWQLWQTQPDPQGYGVDVAKGIVIYRRWGSASSGQGAEEFVIVLNFSPNNQMVDVPFPINGQGQELLNGQTATVENLWVRGEVVESNWGKIFFRSA